MSLLRRLLEPGNLERRHGGEVSGELAGRIRSSTAAGQSVSTDSALRLSTFWACVNLLADVGSALPVDAFRSTAGAPAELPSLPRIIASPSADVAAIDWRRQVWVSWLTRGNAYGLVADTDELGWPTQIELLHPDKVSCVRRQGSWVWRVGRQEVERWPHGELWHEPAFTVPGQPIGLAPVSYAAQSIGLGLAAEQFGAQWFRDGAHPSALLKSEQEIGPDQAAIIKQRFRDAVDGREPVAMGLGIEYEAIQIAADESQFLETIRANVATVARFFRVDPEMIGADSGNSMTYANVEQRGLKFLTYTMQPWLARWDGVFSRLLPRGQYAKINAGGLVRADLMTRYRAHDAAIRAGWRSRDEVRELEDLAPIPDGSGAEFLWPPYSTAPMPQSDDAGVGSSGQQQQQQ